jgi:replicative DNA helicase
VIGALLIDPEACAGQIFQDAKPAHFGEPDLRHVYEAARELWNEHRPLDPVTILNRAGSEYEQLLRGCMESTPTLRNLPAWLEICKTSARLKAMQTEALQIMDAEREADAAAAWERMGSLLQDADQGEDLSLAELIGDYCDRMQDKKPVRYLNWGIEAIDKELYVSGGQFGVIAADSSVGKTALALQFAYHMAADGWRVGFFSLETPKENLEDRLMAEHQVAGIPLPATKRKKLTEEDMRNAGEAGMRSDNIYLRILRNYETLERIRAKTVQRRFDVIFIDYVQLIDAPGRERWDIVTNISMGLHRMAQQLGITVVGLSQITPAVKGQKAPTKDDLRESRQLKQDADFILLLYPDSDEDAPPNARILEIAKNKDGRCARHRLDFEPQHMTFKSHVPNVNEMRSEARMAKEVRRSKKTKAGDLQEIPLEKGEELPF